LFDIRGKTAIVTGASGAFGALASKVLAAAGANAVMAAGSPEALKKLGVECEKLGAKVETVPLRPSSEANCEKIVQAAVDRFGRVDILVIAGGLNKVSKIVEQAPADFLEVIDANVLADGARRRRADARTGRGRQGDPDVIGARSARPSGRLHRLLRLEVCDRRHYQRARREWGAVGITVNALGPTAFRSPLTQMDV
jgi:NAD(P)-dependent dehydrogenase (short-subunit alcohol dehydrogenase family)